MKKFYNIIFIFTMLMICLFSSVSANESNKLPVIVDPENVELIQDWASAMRDEGIDVIILTPEKFNQIENSTYGCIFSVANPEDATFKILQKAFTEEEIKELSNIPNRTMEIKRDLYHNGQRILFFVGSTKSALDDIRKNMRTAWWPIFCSWFDIENTSMHGY